MHASPGEDGRGRAYLPTGERIARPGPRGPDEYNPAKDVDDMMPVHYFRETLGQRVISMQHLRERLPVHKHRRAILYAVEKFRTVIIVGETGSGKTTQVPQYLYEAGWSRDGRVIACTQPRRVAAMAAAARVSEEMNSELGGTVGYAVRFEERCDPARTRIKYMTDGSLLRECLLDPLLTAYSVIMIDEAHERNISLDILLALLKKVQRRRPDLRVVISSATLDAVRFKDYFETNPDPCGLPAGDTATIISVEGRMFPVDVHYLKEPCEDYLSEAVNAVIKIHESHDEEEGDILVFLTGREEIEMAIAQLEDYSTRSKSKISIMAVPLYSGLPISEQQVVFDPAPPNVRKVAISTNVAEASVTIDGIVYVVDSGFVKLSHYDPDTGMSRLIVTPISQASANQRAGRAGRVQPGKAYRLYPQASFYAQMPAQSVPEMHRSDLQHTVLTLKALGIHNVVQFDYFDPPPPALMMDALEGLYYLGALDDRAQLTPTLGLKMAELPLEPELAKCLVESASTYECAQEMVSILSVLSVGDPFIIPPGKRAEADNERLKFMVEEGDLLTLFNVLSAYLEQPTNRRQRWCNSHYLSFKVLERALIVRRQLRQYLEKRFGMNSGSSCGQDTVRLRKCLISGLFSRVARANPDGSYRSLRHDRTLHIHPSSVLFNSMPLYVVFTEATETTKLFMRYVTAIDPFWLKEVV
ncbi:hypothetical protein EV182_001219 [Spiromyces aspiralis]|uniref:Uncharacterized protein n=1 Tax=Spiromyces aspiralis TaxID=68401 RepID=A0ACC1HJ99_9FUNG|nr:hypothetical protein EV182_001219 [Spiromyces aspiralis]